MYITFKREKLATVAACGPNAGTEDRGSSHVAPRQLSFSLDSCAPPSPGGILQRPVKFPCKRVAMTSTVALSSIVSGPSLSSPISSTKKFGASHRDNGLAFGLSRSSIRTVQRERRASLVVRAAKLPQGVEAPKEEPKLPASIWGFTENAEVWNSRASMIGIIGIVLLEFFARRGLLEMVGFEVGKGLDLPL